MVHFLHIGITIAHYRLSEKDPVFNASFTHIVTVFKAISPFLKNKLGFHQKKDFLMSRLFMILLMVSVDVYG